MSIYDLANQLAKEMRESREYQLLKESKDKIDREPDTKDLVQQFLKLGQEIELGRIQKMEVPAETKDRFDGLMRTLQLNSNAMEYLNNLQRFQLMFQDVSRTITDVVKDVMDQPSMM